ncbi:MAG: hypothetical protein AAGE61_13195 [Pseudomonadota bacterium]
MDRDEKVKILQQLSRLESDKAISALQKEFQSAKTSLTDNTDYSAIERTLIELSVYGHRVSDELLPVLSTFLQRLQETEFVTCAPEYAWSSSDLQKKLLCEVLELVERFRYFDIQAVVDILLPFSDYPDDGVSKKAVEALGKCGSYYIQIFYGGKDRAGLGAGPQLEILSYLEANLDQIAQRNIAAIQSLSGAMLSSTMEDRTWDYKSVTWSTAAVPYCEPIRQVRSRSIEFLKSLYELERPIAERLTIIRTLMVAMELPRTAQYEDDLKSLITSNTISILDWLKKIILNERFPVLQKIEHDIYWRYYHGISDEIRQSCLDIRDTLYQNSEYQIYRNLIGFESVFENWEDTLNSDKDFERIEEERRERASNYVSSISEKNWSQWKARILEFCKTESDDLATFPIYFEFLRNLAETHPKLALELVEKHIAEVQFFTIPLYRGLWAGEYKGSCRALLMELCDQGSQLAAISKLFHQDVEADHQLLANVLGKASETSDEYVISLLIGVAASQFSHDQNFAISGLTVPALKRLKELGCKKWVRMLWHNREIRYLISKLNQEQDALLLDALVFVDRIDFQTEEILKPIAEQHPDLILTFFRKRVEFKEAGTDYEAIPFDFQRLTEPMAKHAQLVVETVRSWYDANDGLFQYRGARLVAIIYPRFDSNLEQELVRLGQTGKQSDAYFVLSILSNYEGQPFLHTVAREIVCKHHTNRELMSEVANALIAMGVVHGEYGMAEAYAQKVVEIGYWLNDGDANVRNFAKSYIEDVSLSEQQERERASEEIELRKHKYGVNED